MTKLVFRTSAGRTALSADDRRGLEAAKALARTQTRDNRDCGCGEDDCGCDEAVKAMTAHRLMSPQWYADQERLRNRFAVAQASTPRVLSSAADKVVVGPTGVVAALQAGRAK